MNAVGRPVHRSTANGVAGGGGGGGHHHRHYSDHLLDAASGKWQQPAAPPPFQEFSRMFRSSQRGGEVLLSEPSTPPVVSRASSQRRNGEEFVAQGELSPGLLDLHSLDTDLLPDMPVPKIYDGNSFYNSNCGRSIKDSKANFPMSKQMNKCHALPENNLLKGLLTDKEKSAAAAKIKVVVRKRPLNKKEILKKDEDIIATEPQSNSLTVYETKLKVDLTEYVEKHEFTFDAVLDQNVSNDKVYHETVAPIVPCIFQRTKGTCFAYGQTGSGKTYTMQPLPLKASEDILSLMRQTYSSQGFQLFVSFFEIYGGKLFDLLNDKRKLCMREDGKQQVCIVGLQEYRVSDVEAIREFIDKGNASRSTGTTGANEESSRSHAILQLAVKRSADGSESKPARLVGKLSFIDLAGSERGADTTDNDKQTRMEGAEINKSLLALKECIRALDNDQGHIPFRGSKLTEVLRDSFVGDSRTVMISCISPNSGSCEHTLNTLRYADRVKSLSKGNNPKKDLYSTLNLRDSTVLPLPSVTPTVSPFDEEMSTDSDKIGWSKPNVFDNSLPFNLVNKLSGKDEEKYGSLYSGGLMGPTSESYTKGGKCYEQDTHQWEKGKPEIQLLPFSENKSRKYEGENTWKSVTNVSRNGSRSDDNLNALLQEEEDLVIAHRKQVEDTINIVREEMNLLIEADQPSNQLEDYISRLNTILSRKAEGISNLQKRLTNFQKRLSEHNVLVSSAGY